jgi:hypothetical protein
MKKSILIAGIIISALVIGSQVVTGCGSRKEESTMDTQGQTKADTTSVTYACPMHPEVTGKDGDKCSKCGMKLVAVKSADTTKLEH